MSDIGYCAMASQAPRSEYYGDEGVLQVKGGPGADCIEVFRQDDGLGFGGWLPAGSPGLGSSFNISVMATHLVDCIVEDKDPLCSGRHAMHVTEIMELAGESSRTGRFMSLTSTV